MKTIKNSKDITTLEVGDKVIFGNLEYSVRIGFGYFLHCYTDRNDKIFEVLHINKRNFIEKLGIDANCNVDFPETKSLETLTALVSALFKEYEKQNKLPKTWEEFCEKYIIVKETECFINSGSQIRSLAKNVRHNSFDKNACVSKQEAEAFLALMQLRQLRKAYVKDWEPDWTKVNQKYNILLENDRLKIYPSTIFHRVLSFPTYELAEQFLDNFCDLVEIAKPLL